MARTRLNVGARPGQKKTLADLLLERPRTSYVDVPGPSLWKSIYVFFDDHHIRTLHAVRNAL